MRVEVNVLESGTEPRVSVQHQPALMMALRTGSIEVGSRRSEMMRFTFGAGEMCLVPRHVETWLRTGDLHYLRELRAFRVAGYFWIPSSRRLPSRWLTVMPCGTVLCRRTEAG
jgi:hypothetical protein